MVKCADCGFLSYRDLEDRSLAEAERNFRENGSVIQADRPHIQEILMTGAGRVIVRGGFASIPICFARAAELQSEVLAERGTDNAARVLNTIIKERRRRAFTSWQQGFTPKEHREMIERKWRLIEICMLALVGGGFTALGAWIASL